MALVYDGPGDQPAVLEVRQISDGVSCTGPLEWPGEIRDVKFSPDGNYVAAGGAIKESQQGRPTGQVKVWRAWDGRPCNWGDMRHDLPVNCLAFAPDNLHLAAGSGELDGGRGTVGVWRIFTGQEFYTTDRPKTADRVFAQEHHGLVTSVCFSPDGRRVLSASHDETARVWDARTGAALLEFKHESSVYQAAYSPDGRTIVSGGRDHSARVWKVATGKVAVPPLSHGLTVTQTVFSPDGERVLTTTDDGARIWELRTGEPLAPILKLSDPIWKMTISADGRLAVAVSRSGAIRTWDTQRSTEGRPFAVPEERLPALSVADGVFFSADASLALIARGARAQIWNTRGGAAASPVMDNGAPISFAVFSPDRTRVLLASGTRGATKGVTRLWDVTSGNPIGQPLEAAGVVTFATFSADGRYLLTASGTRSPASGEARVWDVESGRPVTSPLLHDEEVTHASFSPDLRHAVTASVDNTAKIWSLDLSARTPAETATESRPLAEHSADLIHASFSPDGRTVVTASYDRTAVLWDATTGDRISVLQHPGWINDVSFSRDGRFLVTACADQTVRVWEAATGEWISLFHHNGEVTRAFFAGDEDLDVTTLSAYEPAQTLPDAQRSVPPPGGGSSEPDRDQAIPRTMLKVQRWRLPQAPQPALELYDFAQLMRSRQIAEKRDFTRLPRHEFARRWNERAGVVAQFNADVPAVPARYAAQESEATGEWFACKWHLDRLIAAEPADIGLRVRRGFASANLLQWPAAVEDYLEAAKQEPSRPILLRLARAEIEIGKLDQAIAHATQGIDALAPAAPTPADKTDERNLRMLRAEAYSATQRWDEAAADLLKSIELKPRLPSSYQRLAIVRLKQGQDAEYRKLCAQMLDLFGDDDGLASTAAWACVLRERAVADYAIVVNLAGRTLADQPGSYYNLNTLGAALYRAGRYREAIEKLTESRAAYVKAASQAQTRSEADALLMPLQDGRPADWLFLAMAESKSGRSAEAEAWLKRAEDSMTSRSITDPRRTWHRLELELLLEEATAQIRPTP